jgi:predicted site-specific integrase-resolvase
MAVRLLTTEEYAALARTAPSTIRWWRHVGRGPTGTKRGRRVLYRADEVERYLGAEDVQVAPTGGGGEAA